MKYLSLLFRILAALMVANTTGWASETSQFRCADLLPAGDFRRIRPSRPESIKFSEEHPAPNVLRCNDPDSEVEWWINPNTTNERGETFFEEQRRTASKGGAQKVAGVGSDAFIPIVNGRPMPDWLYILSGSGKYVISILAAYPDALEIGKTIHANLEPTTTGKGLSDREEAHRRADERIAHMIELSKKMAGSHGQLSAQHAQLVCRHRQVHENLESKHRELLRQNYQIRAKLRRMLESHGQRPEASPMELSGMEIEHTRSVSDLDRIAADFQQMSADHERMIQEDQETMVEPRGAKQ